MVVAIDTNEIGLNPYGYCLLQLWLHFASDESESGRSIEVTQLSDVFMLIILSLILLMWY